MNIYDDVLVYGGTEIKHRIALCKLLNRLRKIGRTANLDKCVFGVTEIVFFGKRFSAKGMMPDPSKIETLKNADSPNDVSELKAFLGMTNFSSQFIKKYSDKTAKLREILSDEWNWTDEHQRGFEELKNSLQGDTVLGCFDVTANTKVIVDASPVGLRRHTRTNTKVGNR